MEIETEEHLYNLIKNQIEESTNLEYKDPRALNNNKEIAKDISAMANSNGGVIIYGLCEDNKDHKPTRIDWIKDNQQKERIEQVLQANVTPKIEIRIKSVLCKVDSSKFILKVEVPKSDTAPHQDHFDKDRRIYWRRNGYTTREMEHYEVESLFFTRKSPKLEIFLKDVSESRDRPAFNIYIRNIGKVVAEQTHIQLSIPPEYKIDPDWDKIRDDFRGTTYQHTLREDLIYPKIPIQIAKIYHSKKFEFGDLKINFLIVCKDMDFMEGELYISCDGMIKVVYGQPKHPVLSRVISDYIFLKNNPFKEDVEGIKEI